MSKRGDSLSSSLVKPPSAATGDGAFDGVVGAGPAFEYLLREIFCEKVLVCTPLRVTRLHPARKLRANISTIHLNNVIEYVKSVVD